MTKITMHYNGDGKHELRFRKLVVSEDGRYVFLTPSQFKRLDHGRAGSGCDGTVGHATFTLDGLTVRLMPLY